MDDRGLFDRRTLLKTAGTAAALSAVLGPAACAPTGSSAPAASAPQVRWDFVKLLAATPITFGAGGSGVATAEDGSRMTLTGSGTFRPPPSSPNDVTGGGTWNLIDQQGVSAGSGTYTVKTLIYWTPGSGTFPTTTNVDKIGEIAQTITGFAVLRVSYSNGKQGILALSSHLPMKVPDAVFNGMVASMGVVLFWNHQKISPPPLSMTDPHKDENRTVFHVLGASVSSKQSGI
jgi:hypothetical protein